MYNTDIVYPNTGKILFPDSVYIRLRRLKHWGRPKATTKFFFRRVKALCESVPLGASPAFGASRFLLSESGANGSWFVWADSLLGGAERVSLSVSLYDSRTPSAVI